MPNTPDLLDLDAIAPIPKFVKLNGKRYEVKPLTIQQLINLERLEQALTNIKSMEDVEKLVQESFSEFIPAIKEEGLFFTTEQMWAIIKFAQNTSVPQQSEAGAQTAKEYAPKKKEDSLKESPASSDSIPATK